ncbi:helix-turn-helix domain-containing protein [Ruminococcaceae bacterium OttesenSCG-928-L11]|nr:helix-turn-helix domain-containing protein [Ruminococcaceae bacterium OttesenSCG-928-L11]
MNMRKNKQPKRAIWSMTLSYLIILMLPVLVSCAVFGVSLNSLREQSRQLGRASALQARGNIETQLDTVRSISRSLLINPSTVNLMYYTGGFTPVKISVLKQLQSDIIRKASTEQYIDGVYTMFLNSHTVLSSQNVYYKDEFNRQYAAETNGPLENWWDHVAFPGIAEFRIQQDEAGGSPKIIYRQKNSTSQPDNSADVIVMVVINADRFFQTIGGSIDDVPEMILLDHMYEAASSSERPLSYEEGLGLMAGKGDSLWVSLFGREPICTAVDSSVEGWSYLLLSPSAEFTQSVQIFVAVIIGYLIFCLAGGAVLIRFLAKRQYSPLRNLTDMVEQDPSLPLEGSPNEYIRLETAIQNLYNHKLDSETRILLYRSTLQTSMLINLLQGAVLTKCDLAVMEEKYGLKFVSDYFCVLLFNPEEWESTEPLDDPSTDADIQVSDLLRTYLTTHLDAFLPAGTQAFSVTVDNMAACLLNPPDSTADLSQFAVALHRDMAGLHRQIQADLSCRLSIAVSTLQSGISEISVAYNEARDVMEYIAILDLREQVVLYKPATDFQSSDLAGIIVKEQAFLNCVRVEDYRNAKKLINEIAEEFFLEENCPLQQAKLRMSALMNGAISAFEEIRPRINEQIFADMDPIETLSLTKSASELTELFNTLFDRLLAFSDEQKHKDMSAKDKRILDYIHEHYRDPCVNASSIAEAFGLSLPQLSKRFKTITGTGVLDYLHLLRIEEAKRVMLEQDLNVKDASEAVGYSNSLALVRAFRRYEGITPGAYKTKLMAGG